MNQLYDACICAVLSSRGCINRGFLFLYIDWRFRWGYKRAFLSCARIRRGVSASFGKLIRGEFIGMAAIPRQVEYALMALADMYGSADGRLFSVRELCERHLVPFDVMSKSMQRLARAGILSAVQGVNGGYQIANQLESVSLLDVMDAVSGEIRAVNCLRSDKTCPLETSCNVTSFMSELDTRLRAFYSDILISDLVQPRMSMRTVIANLSGATG